MRVRKVIDLDLAGSKTDFEEAMTLVRIGQKGEGKVFNVRLFRHDRIRQGLDSVDVQRMQDSVRDLIRLLDREADEGQAEERAEFHAGLRILRRWAEALKA